MSKLHLRYDESDIIENQESYLRESGEYSESEISDMISSDSDIFDIEWEFIIDEMNESLKEKGIYFKVNGYNMGWMNRSGEKYFTATDSKEFFSEMLPTCDLTLDIRSYYKGYKMIIYHHDSPTGESYIIKPVSSREYELNT